jgi:hypothetical protein
MIIFIVFCNAAVTGALQWVSGSKEKFADWSLLNEIYLSCRIKDIIQVIVISERLRSGCLFSPNPRLLS